MQLCRRSGGTGSGEDTACPAGDPRLAGQPGFKRRRDNGRLNLGSVRKIELVLCGRSTPHSGRSPEAI